MNSRLKDLPKTFKCSILVWNYSYDVTVPRSNRWRHLKCWPNDFSARDVSALSLIALYAIWAHFLGEMGFHPILYPWTRWTRPNWREMARKKNVFLRVSRRADRSLTTVYKIKAIIMRTLILFTFLYACESWTWTAEIERRIQALEMRCYRRHLNFSYKDHVTNEEVRNRIQNAVGVHDDLLTMVKMHTYVQDEFLYSDAFWNREENARCYGSSFTSLWRLWSQNQLDKDWSSVPASTWKVLHITVNGQRLQVVDKFAYLETIWQTTWKCLGSNGMRLAQNLKYTNSIFFNACETWAVDKRLTHFHLCCLRKLQMIRWDD